MTLARSTALRLIDPALKTPVLTPENFAAHQARLAQAATEFYIVRSRGQPLTPRHATVELTEENDVVFKIIYPPPRTGPLRFHAAFLQKLGDGYGSMIEANAATGTNLGWERLTFESPDFDIVVPAPSTSRKSPP